MTLREHPIESQLIYGGTELGLHRCHICRIDIFCGPELVLLFLLPRGLAALLLSELLRRPRAAGAGLLSELLRRARAGDAFLAALAGVLDEAPPLVETILSDALPQACGKNAARSRFLIANDQSASKARSANFALAHYVAAETH